MLEGSAMWQGPIRSAKGAKWRATPVHLKLYKSLETHCHVWEALPLTAKLGGDISGLTMNCMVTFTFMSRSMTYGVYQGVLNSTVRYHGYYGHSPVKGLWG